MVGFSWAGDLVRLGWTGNLIGIEIRFVKELAGTDIQLGFIFGWVGDLVGLYWVGSLAGLGW